MHENLFFLPFITASFMLRMMNLFLGEGIFRTGVSNYLKKYAYGNAEQDDLWQSLTEAALQSGLLPNNTTVKMIMDTWTLQTGYPMISVERNYESGTATISQVKLSSSKFEHFIKLFIFNW